MINYKYKYYKYIKLILEINMEEQYRLYEYKDENGNFDYESYRKTQEYHNKRKIKRVWATEDGIKLVCEKKSDAKKILCHGTRNGSEQRFFQKFIPDCDVLGTEISETATQFPNTIQWDFHNVKDDWVNNFDIIYSNSLDHSYKPKECLKTWAKCINENGYLVLEYSQKGHGVRASNSKDPFGIQREYFPIFIEESLGDGFCIDEVVDVDGRRKLFFIKKSI